MRGRDRGIGWKEDEGMKDRDKKEGRREEGRKEG